MAPRTAILYIRPLGGAAPDVDLPHVDDERFAVVAVVHDKSGEERAKLPRVLHGLASGTANAVVAPQLRSVASSLRDLVAILDWLETVDADLLAIDIGLDTGSAAGRRFAAMLREIDGWGREPRPGHRGRGRPGPADEAPELVDRLAELRDRGLSLQAIADALNAEGVPTPRGGAEWRPSSVQAALGYRRPRPPAPGLPPPPPPPPGPPGRRRPSGPPGPPPRRGPRP